MKTRQELFNNAYLGFASQGWLTARDDEDSCMYRADDGKRCAIGWNIADADYSPALENCSVYNPSAAESWTTDAKAKSLRIAAAAGVQEADYAFADALQKTHDNASNYSLKSAMEEFAGIWNLTIPELPLPASITGLLNTKPTDALIEA